MAKKPVPKVLSPLKRVGRVITGNGNDIKTPRMKTLGDLGRRIDGGGAKLAAADRIRKSRPRS